MCGKQASVTYNDGDDADLKVALAHELPTCKRFDVITDADTGADYMRDCRLSAALKLN